MPIDILNLPLNATKFLHRFMDDKSLLQLREVSKVTKELADFAHQRFRNTLVRSLEISTEQNKTRVSFRYLFRHPDASNYWDYYASKTCFKRALRTLNITDYWFSEYRKAIVALVNSTELAQLYEHLKLLTKRTVIYELHISSCTMPDTIDMCLSFVERKIISMVTITNRPARDMNYAAYLKVIKQVHPKKIYFTTQVLPKNAIDFVLKLANQVHTISVAYGDLGTAIPPSPNISAFILAIILRKCEKIEIADRYSCHNYSVTDSEKLIKILHNNPEKMVTLAYYEDRSEPIDIQIGSYKFFTVDQPRWINIKRR